MSDEPGQVLLIDQDGNWLRAARSALSGAGCEVHTAQQLSTAHDRLRNEQFDLILVDLKEAEQGRGDFHQLAELQASRGGKTVVLFATELTSEKVSSFLGLGADDCLDKPYDLSALVTLVQEQLATVPDSIASSQGERQQPLDRPAKVLIVEDEPDWSKRLSRYLSRDADQYVIQCAGDYAAAKIMVEESDLDVIILDLRLIENSEDFQGMQLLELLRKGGPTVSVVVVSAYGTVAHVKDGFQLYNISAYLSKQSFSPDRFRAAVRRAARQRRRKA